MLLLAASDAWTGSSGARHLPTDAAQASSRLSRALPFSLGAFMRDYYDRKMLRLNHTKTHFDPAELEQEPYDPGKGYSHSKCF